MVHARVNCHAGLARRLTAQPRLSFPTRLIDMITRRVARQIALGVCAHRVSALTGLVVRRIFSFVLRCGCPYAPHFFSSTFPVASALFCANTRRFAGRCFLSRSACFPPLRLRVLNFGALPFPGLSVGPTFFLLSSRRSPAALRFAFACSFLFFAFLRHSLVLLSVMRPLRLVWSRYHLPSCLVFPPSPPPVVPPTSPPSRCLQRHALFPVPARSFFAVSSAISSILCTLSWVRLSLSFSFCLRFSSIPAPCPALFSGGFGWRGMRFCRWSLPHLCSLRAWLPLRAGARTYFCGTVCPSLLICDCPSPALALPSFASLFGFADRCALLLFSHNPWAVCSGCFPAPMPVPFGNLRPSRAAAPPAPRHGFHLHALQLLLFRCGFWRFWAFPAGTSFSSPPLHAARSPLPYLSQSIPFCLLFRRDFAP